MYSRVASALLRPMSARLSNVQPMSASTTIRWLSAEATANNSGELNKRLGDLVKSETVFLFMKGTPDEPMCGFSKLTCKVMEMHGVPFKSFNVLDDEVVRQGIKEFSEWPTIPQVYIGGEFVGGADIMVEMHQNGELITLLKEQGIKSLIEDN